MEHQNLWGGIIDVDPKNPLNIGENIFQCIEHSQDENQFAIRSNKCLVPRLECKKSLKQPISKIQFKSDSTYLITGGLGGLGVEVASWMIDRGARHLLLFSRRTLPSREEWKRLKNAKTKDSEAIQAIINLESQGAKCTSSSL